MGTGTRGISIGFGAMAVGKIREVDGREFHELLSSTDRLVVAEFYMEGCPACAAMAPVLDDIAREMTGEAVFVKIDARRNMDVTLQLGVVATPTFLLFCRETFLMEMVGLVHPAAFRNALNDMLKHRAECAGRAMVSPSEMNG